MLLLFQAEQGGPEKGSQGQVEGPLGLFINKFSCPGFPLSPGAAAVRSKVQIGSSGEGRHPGTQRLLLEWLPETAKPSAVEDGQST